MGDRENQSKRKKPANVTDEGGRSVLGRSKVLTPEKKAEQSRKRHEYYLKNKRRKAEAKSMMDNSSGSGNVDLLPGGSMALVRSVGDTFDQICHAEARLSAVVVGENSSHTSTKEPDCRPIVKRSNDETQSLIDKSPDSGTTVLLPGGVSLKDLLKNPEFIAEVNSMFGSTLSIDKLSRIDTTVQPMVVRNTEPILDPSLAVTTDDSYNVMTKVVEFPSSSAGCSTNVIGSDNVCVKENISTIAQISTETRTPWRVRVRVIEKGFPRLGRNPVNPITYLRCILKDEEGNRVQATIFGDDIDLMGNKLNLLKMCFVSDAVVQNIAIEHRVVPNEYQWTINSKTSRIEPILQDSSYQIRNPYNLVPFTRFDDYLNLVSTIDVLAAVGCRLSDSF